MVVPRAAAARTLEQVSGHAFGTTWRLLGPGSADFRPLAAEIEALFVAVDLAMSPWRPDSAITRFNTSAGQTAFQCPPLAEVASKALTIARASHGAFDPTVGPLVARWGFGPIDRGGAPDWRGITTQGRTLSKARGDLTLDLCGIAKGWALDRAADLLRAAGLGTFLMEVGGEFAASGTHPDGRPWRIAVDLPPSSSASAPTLRLPPGAAVATSGTWEQSYELGAETYNHIIDVTTGRPLASALRSVTVVAEDAAMADGWATALCAAGEKEGPTLARANDIAALFLIERDGRVHPVATPPIREFLL